MLCVETHSLCSLCTGMERPGKMLITEPVSGETPVLTVWDLRKNGLLALTESLHKAVRPVKHMTI